MFALYYLRNWLKCQRGQDLIEYALLAGFIALVAVAAVILAGQGVSSLFGEVATQVQEAAGQ
jgi:Flp pilus assembly pilin Flp